MHKQLPARPNLEQLKKRAKALLREVQASTPGALARAAEHHPQWSDAATTSEAKTTFTLTHAQLIIAREYGFDSWPKLRAHITELKVTPHDEVSARYIREAAGQGDLNRLEALLKAHPELINEPGGPGVRTALHQAVFGNKPEAVAMLLARGADPNIRCEGDNAYPLHFAVEKHKFPIVKLLIEHGADPIGEGDYHELGVIGWATAWDYIEPDPEIVEFLLAHGARHNIFSAVSMDATDDIRRIVSESPDRLEVRMNGTKMRRFPLHLAVIKRQLGSCQTLLDLGANIESLDEAGFTALDQAALDHQSTMTKLLLERGAKVRLPAAIALQRTHDIQKLLARDPDCLKPGERWGTLIVRAAVDSSALMIDELILHGADVNVSDSPTTAVDSTGGYTPLHAAAFHGNMSTVEALIRNGANAQLRETKWHGTPAGWANYAGHIAVRDRILLEPVDIMEAVENSLVHRIEVILKSDPEAINRPIDQYPIFPLYAEAWFTPLAFAIALDKQEVVLWLLEHGVDASIHSPEGHSLIDLAHQKGFAGIETLLKNHTS